MDSIPVIGLLTEARDFLASGHWTQERMVEVTADGVEHRDMGGALLYAGLKTIGNARWDDSSYEFELYSTAKEILTRIVEHDGYPSLEAFNDHPRRTLRDVVTAFDIAIAHLDGSLR